MDRTITKHNITIVSFSFKQFPLKFKKLSSAPGAVAVGDFIVKRSEINFLNKKNRFKIIYSSLDRVRISEWVRKLVAIDDDSCENIKKKNEYIQYLKIQVANSCLQLPFTKPPPSANLPSLPELLVNNIYNFTISMLDICEINIISSSIN